MPSFMLRVSLAFALVQNSNAKMQIRAMECDPSNSGQVGWDYESVHDHNATIRIRGPGLHQCVRKKRDDEKKQFHGDLVLDDCDGDETNLFTWAGQPVYPYIRNVHKKQCLDVYQWKGPDLKLHDCTKKGNEMWEFNSSMLVSEFRKDDKSSNTLKRYCLTATVPDLSGSAIDTEVEEEGANEDADTDATSLLGDDDDDDPIIPDEVWSGPNGPTHSCISEYNTTTQGICYTRRFGKPYDKDQEAYCSRSRPYDANPICHIRAWNDSGTGDHGLGGLQVLGCEDRQHKYVGQQVLSPWYGLFTRKDSSERDKYYPWANTTRDAPFIRVMGRSKESSKGMVYALFVWTKHGLAGAWGEDKHPHPDHLPFNYSMGKGLLGIAGGAGNRIDTTYMKYLCDPPAPVPPQPIAPSRIAYHAHLRGCGATTTFQSWTPMDNQKLGGKLLQLTPTAEYSGYEPVCLADTRNTPQQCMIDLRSEKDSHNYCEIGKTFGCNDDNTMWISGGCQGHFSCNGEDVKCEDKSGKTCKCHGPPPLQHAALVTCNSSDPLQNWYLEQHPSKTKRGDHYTFIKSHDKQSCLTMPHGGLGAAVKLTACESSAPTHCSISLTKQESKVECIQDQTFGCSADDNSMWVSNGCRGKFICNGDEVKCDDKNHADKTCSCPTGPADALHQAWFHDPLMYPFNTLRTAMLNDDKSERMCLSAFTMDSLPSKPPLPNPLGMCMTVTRMLPMAIVPHIGPIDAGLARMESMNGLAIQLPLNSNFSRCALYDPFGPIELREGTLEIALELPATPYMVPWIHVDHAPFGVHLTITVEGTAMASIRMGLDYKLTSPFSIGCHNFLFGMPNEHFQMHTYGGAAWHGIVEWLDPIIKKILAKGIPKTVNKIVSKVCPIGTGGDEAALGVQPMADYSTVGCEDAVDQGPIQMMHCLISNSGFAPPYLKSLGSARLDTASSTNDGAWSGEDLAYINEPEENYTPDDI